MTTVPDLVAAAEAAPPGPGTLAVFDYDGTVIGGYSAADVFGHRLRSRQMGPGELLGLVAAARRGIADETAFRSFLESALGRWAGTPRDELDALGRDLFKHRTAGRLHHEVFAVLEAHRRRGHTLVLASSALPFQTTPAAETLGFDHVVCTAIETDADDRLTGRALGTPVWGAEKARRVEELAAELGADTADAFAYSNGREDVPLLASCGHAVAVAPDDELRREAARHGWPVLDCADPAPSPGVRDAVRTAAFYGTFAGAMGVAGGIGLARRSRRSFADIAFGVGADVSLAAAGIDVRVVSGAGHLWAARPAVFVFNHASKIDTIVMAKLLRQDFTGVAKAEAKNVPMFGQLFQIAGIALIDRADAGAARAKMSPLVDQLRDGVSVAVSPEGTRTTTPRMAPFKKGPFHIAHQAGVPVVPIVFRGIDRVQWRGAQVVRAGTVEAVVLPAVPTDDWTTETMADHRDDVRARMQAVLDDWPTDRTRELAAGATS